ncbi:MAG: hypothetical protein WD971_00755 [Pirellulales bacterium]
MDKRIERIGRNLGAKRVATLPDVGGGAFGMSRLAQILQARLAPSAGKRPGRPTNDRWTERCKVPMSADTLAELQALSSRLSSEKRKVSPMQLAAQLLEESVLQFAVGNTKSGRRKSATAKK